MTANKEAMTLVKIAGDYCMGTETHTHTHNH